MSNSSIYPSFYLAEFFFWNFQMLEPYFDQVGNVVVYTEDTRSDVRYASQHGYHMYNICIAMYRLTIFYYYYYYFLVEGIFLLYFSIFDLWHNCAVYPPPLPQVTTTHLYRYQQLTASQPPKAKEALAWGGGGWIKGKIILKLTNTIFERSIALLSLFCSERNRFYFILCLQVASFDLWTIPLLGNNPRPGRIKIILRTIKYI